MSYARPELLAEPDWLLEHANDPNVRIIDCATLEAYRRAHIPGAVQLPTHYYIKEPGPPGADHGTAWLIATKPPFAWLHSRATPGCRSISVTAWPSFSR